MTPALPVSNAADTAAEISSALNWAFAHVSRSTATVSILAVLSTIGDLRAASALRAIRDADAETVARAGVYLKAGVISLVRILWVSAGCLVFFIGRAILLDVCSLWSREGVDVLMVLVAVAISGCGFVPWSTLRTQFGWSSPSATSRFPTYEIVQGRLRGFVGRHRWLAGLPSKLFYLKALIVNALLLAAVVLDYSIGLDKYLLHLAL